MSDAEVESAIARAIHDCGARGMADMGRVMAALRLQLAGRADMGKVSTAVKARLAQA
jgi:uncharacterized protein YqeY